MANDYTDEEKQRYLNQWHESLEKGIPVNERTANVMEDVADSTGEAKKRIDELNAAFNKMGKGAKDWTRSMYDGKQGAEAMNGSIDTVVGALELFITLIPGARLLKIALTATIGVIAAYAKAANEQADALFKSYQDLSRNGLASAGGMTEIYKNMQQFGYGIKELGQMTELLKENSEALASFGGTASTGTQAFAAAAEQIQRNDIGRTFQMMGKTPDEINRGIAMFIKSQQGIGISNAQIQKNIAARSADYIMQLDLLSKLTGKSAEQLQAGLDQANAEQAFNQVQYELQQKANAGDDRARKQVEENEKLAKIYAGTEFGKEFFQGVGGDISAMTKTLMTAPEVVALIQKGDYTAAQIQDALARGSKQSRDSYGNLFKMNAGGFLLPIKELSASTSRYADSTAESQEELAKAQQELQKKGLDPSTKAMVELRIEQQKTRDSMQNFVHKGVDFATTALKSFAEVANEIAGVVPGTNSETANKDNQIGGGNISADAKQIMATIRTHESQGNYTAQAQGSTASGAYQFLDSSWKELSKKYGIGTEYNRAKEAPREVQDAVAAKFVEEILKNNNNDVRAVFKTWYTGNAKGNISKEAMAKNNNLTADQMADQFEAIYRKIQAKEGTGSDTKKSENTTTVPPKTVRADGTETGLPKIKADTGFEGMLTGPKGGYRPDITMHGTEQIKITPQNTDTQLSNTNSGESDMIMMQQLEKMDRLVQIVGDQGGSDLIARQLDKLDELVRAMQNQVNVSNKILQAAR
jgi:muramidase (phage lysozyme)